MLVGARAGRVSRNIGASHLLARGQGRSWPGSTSSDIPARLGDLCDGDNGRVVHEYILATVLRDETEPLCVIEPLDRALRHCYNLLKREP